ncbi:MAG: haloacid dehalogenase-like hydrolase [Gammaproteobacteria bacterium]|nr:haloacid dehalogenase-like hydrolase [Gammaproteobacteria bacterium]
MRMILALLGLALSFSATATDWLPSWKQGPAAAALESFVARTTDPRSRDFVPPAERIAVFDNDGTLWAEQPVYFQLAFALDRVKAMAPRHPEWRAQEPFASLLKGDLKSALAGGEHAVLEIVMATHGGMTTDQFEKTVRDWLATARHPKTGRPYTDMAYQPMVELLAFLRANGYKTFIVSGGGVEFMRPWTERVYGIPPEQVVGSSIRTKYEMRDGQPVIARLPEIDFIDDKAGKPVGIHKFIGRRPVLAVGNSDGDFEMLEWATSGPGPRLGLIIHHDDAAREWAYDRESSIGRLARGLDEGPRRGWVIVSMRDDWSVVFPPP